MSAWVHALLPVVVIVAAAVLCALGKLTDAETITLLSAAAGLGAVTVARKDKGPQ